MKGRTTRALVITLAALGLAHGADTARAQVTGFNKTTAGAHVYTDDANWVDGNINGIWNSDLTLGADQTVTFGGDTTLNHGWTFDYSGNRVLTLKGTADSTVTLGGNILHDTTGNMTVNIGSITADQALNVNLGDQTRTISVSSSRTLNFHNVISNGGLLLDGRGTTQLYGANSYSDATTINFGTLTLLGAEGSSANSDFFVNANFVANSTLFIDSTVGTGTTRAKSVTLNGTGSTGNLGVTALLNVRGNSANNTLDTISGDLTASAGASIITLTANAATNTRLHAASFVRSGQSTVLFRGSTLGETGFALQTAGQSNLTFGATPASMSGAGTASGTKTMSIIKGAYGDSTTTGNGFGIANGTSATGGLVTYDTDNGVRLLTASEYETDIVDGQTALSNVRFINATGGTQVLRTLTEATTRINSLSFNVTGAEANGGITIAGDPGTTLVVESGVIYGAQLSSFATGNTTNAMLISVPILDFNGGEGVILANTNGVSGNRSGGTLNISSSIQNDGGNGVTIGGPGITRFLGTNTSANTYTGATTVNSGVLVLTKSSAVSIPGDLVINGGGVEAGTGQFASSSNVTINRGSLRFVIGNQGQANSGTFNNLNLNGGSYSSGASGHNGLVSLLGAANLAGGTANISANQDMSVAGLTTFSGTTMTIAAAVSTSNVYDTNFTLTGGLAIVNTDSGAYTPLTMNAGASATNRGARVNLDGDLTFTGNATNTNTTTIAAAAPPEGGQRAEIAISGARTFQIGDGAADTDLAIQANIIDGTAGSSIDKTGAGTLSLLGENTYTGATTVSNGTLIVGGSLSGSGVTVAGGAHLAGTGVINAALSGAGAINPGNSPGLLIAESVDGSGGLDFNFEFTEKNVADLNWAALENDVLRLTDASPFASALNGDNVLSLYLDEDTYSALTTGDILLGGFYTDSDVLASLTGAGIQAYYQNALGGFSYNGNTYSLLTAGTFAISEVSNTQFSGGGQLTQFTFTAVPEASAPFMAISGLLLLTVLRRRRK